jgi:TRAP-type mannitol/chloroaromatic compound transport system substrate-binding protein
MDRREFLKTTGVAAAATTTAGGAGSIAAAASAEAPAPGEIATPAIRLGGRELVLALPVSIDTLDIGAHAEGLARRLEAALGEDTRIAVARTIETGLEAVTTGIADLYFGLENQHATYHPAFHVAAGLPIGTHLGAGAQYAWLTTGSGRELFDELSAGFGIRAFAAGTTGPSGGLFAERLIETADDLAGLRIACRGLAREVVAALGATPVAANEAELVGALAGRGLDAAEPLTAPAAAVAHWAFQPGLTPGGYVLTLGMRASFHDRLGRSGQAIVEGIAGAAFAAASAEAVGRQAMLAEVARFGRWPVATAMPGRLEAALGAAAVAALERVGGHDPLAARMVDSHRAFRDAVAGRDAAIS